MPTATITSKGQITLPKEVREALGVGTGDRVEFVAEEKGVYKLLPATRDVRSLKGLVSKPAKPVGVEDMIRAIVRGASKRR
jgi:AbrB family looped-hinge helix DNA binding protein